MASNFEYILEQIRTNKIKDVDLSGQDLRKENMDRLCAALKENTSVEKMRLNRCQIGSSELENLLGVLGPSQTLRHLNVSNNPIQDFSSLGNFLRQNTSLTAFQAIGLPTMTMASTTNLIQGLKANTTVTELAILTPYIPADVMTLWRSEVTPKLAENLAQRTAPTQRALDEIRETRERQTEREGQTERKRKTEREGLSEIERKSKKPEDYEHTKMNADKVQAKSEPSPILFSIFEGFHLNKFVLDTKRLLGMDKDNKDEDDNKPGL